MISWLHLLWIIPLAFILGYITCGLLMANGIAEIEEVFIVPEFEQESNKYENI